MMSKAALFWVFIAFLAMRAQHLAAGNDLDDQEQAAFAAAVEKVAPSVVRIETVGGLERVGQSLFGTGPTTGLAVDPSGYVLSSTINFANQPSAIFVRLADGTRKPAKLVATDHARLIVLLKIDAGKPLSTCKIAPLDQLKVGQWAIAVGRTMESDRPNAAVGILSALGRVWGKAVQTDAAVSPNNYGGPLVDIDGRVIGILTPLSPDSAEATAGVEWYDSGIGFAVPIEDVNRVLSRLKNGEDLFPGKAGLTFKNPNIYTAEPIIDGCAKKGPADVSGLRPGDKIIEIDGKTIVRLADVRTAIYRRYAGDTISVIALRAGEKIQRTVELRKVDKTLAKAQPAEESRESSP